MLLRRRSTTWFMRLLCSATISACMLAALADGFAGPGRTPVKGTPLIVGQEVPRFVLTGRIDINREAPGLSNVDVMDRVQCRLLPGQFVPVSEDGKGVYYQGANGVQRLGSTSAEPGGLYVSKTRAERVCAYIGDARAIGAELIVDVQSIATNDLRKLKIARPAR